VGPGGQEVLVVLVLVETMLREDCANGVKALQVPLPSMVASNRNSKIQERLIVDVVVFVLVNVYGLLVGKDNAVVIVIG
jgi:hypothetical protein